ncbi:hypothetical protein [Streptomyces sp. NPDC003943]
MGDAKRVDWKWIWLTVGLMALLFLPVACVAANQVFWDEVGKPQPADCTEAMSWAGATLPKSAESARCTEATWTDTTVEAEFRMPRGEAAEWLAGTWPSVPAEVTPGGLRLRLDYDDTAGASGAYDIAVDVRYEGGDTALVQLTAGDY